MERVERRFAFTRNTSSENPEVLRILRAGDAVNETGARPIGSRPAAATRIEASKTCAPIPGYRLDAKRHAFPRGLE